MNKTSLRRTIFGRYDIEKIHAIIMQTIFPNQNIQIARGLDYFWKLRCRKSIRRCGPKYISISKYLKDQGFGPLLEVQMSKKSTPLWCKIHFEIKIFKPFGIRIFFWRFRYHFISLHNIIYMTLHYTPLQDIILHYTTFRHTPLHHITLHYIPPHSTTPHYIALHYVDKQTDK